jgi:hypothetical protein
MQNRDASTGERERGGCRVGTLQERDRGCWWNGGDLSKTVDLSRRQNFDTL